MKNRFISLLRQVNRAGIEDLLEYLEKSDFYFAPASTRYHGACEGGLLQHSLAVYDNLQKFRQVFVLPYNHESIIICCLLHDICKSNFYRKGYKNKKNDVDGLWERVECYDVCDQLPLGHGEKSVIIIQKFIRLLDEEMLAIRWHMGGFDEGVKGYSSSQSLSAAMSKYPLVVSLHMADLAACYIDKK